MEAGTAAAVDIARTADLVVGGKKMLRKVLEKARATAKSATSAVKVFVVKNVLAVAVGCCSRVVSVIKKGELSNLDVEERFILVSRLKC
jgi:hypothetical protein